MAMDSPMAEQLMGASGPLAHGAHPLSDQVNLKVLEGVFSETETKKREPQDVAVTEVEEIAEKTSENAAKLFNLPKL